jgi:hypothetical protein
LRSENGFVQSLAPSFISQKSTAREFFSKENTSHPTVEENQILKKRVEKLRELKEKSRVGLDEGSVRSLKNQIT